MNPFDALIAGKTVEQRREWMEPVKRNGRDLRATTQMPPRDRGCTTNPVNAAALVLDHGSGCVRLVPIYFAEIV